MESDDMMNSSDRYLVDNYKKSLSSLDNREELHQTVENYVFRSKFLEYVQTNQAIHEELQGIKEHDCSKDQKSRQRLDYLVINNQTKRMDSISSIGTKKTGQVSNHEVGISQIETDVRSKDRVPSFLANEKPASKFVKLKKKEEPIKCGQDRLGVNFEERADRSISGFSKSSAISNDGENNSEYRSSYDFFYIPFLKLPNSDSSRENNK